MPLEENDMKIIQGLMEKVLGQYEVRFTAAMEQAIEGKVSQKMKGLTDVVDGILETDNSAPGSAEGGELFTAFLKKLLGNGAAGDGTVPGLTAQLQGIAEIFGTVKKVFMEPMMDAQRVGMQQAANAFGYAYRATGRSPDPEEFNRLIEGEPKGNGAASKAAGAALAAEITRLAREG